MKLSKITILLGVATAALYLTACSSNSGHDHSGHDHSSHDHGEKKPAEHDHSSHQAGEHKEAIALPAGTKPYTLKTCIVSGEKLDAMGKPIVMVHEGQEIRFCCNDCVTQFKAEPAKYLAKLKK